MKNSLVKTNAEHFYRDESTTALLNMDKASFMAYKKQREKVLKAEEVFKEVDTIKQEMTDIKLMLKELLADKVK